MNQDQNNQNPSNQDRDTFETSDNIQNDSPNETKYSDYFKDVVRPVPEEVIIKWNAPSRPFKKRNKQYHTTIITIALLLSLILFFAGQVITVAVVFAVAFLAYVTSTIPPHTVENKITTYGIRTDDLLFYWQELGRFWFDESLGDRILYVESGKFPYRLTLLIGKIQEQELSEILSEVLLKQKPELTPTEKFAEWLKKKVPLDLDS